MPGGFRNRIGSNRYGGTGHLQNLQMSIRGGQAFRDFSPRHNDVSSRFVRNIFGELAQHANSIKLDSRHDQHEENRDS